jgi:hypothetical protein
MPTDSERQTMLDQLHFRWRAFRAAGLCPLAFAGCRRVVRRNLPRLRTAWWLLLVIEGVHLGAVFSG